jgi:hypothetical protein
MTGRLLGKLKNQKIVGQGHTTTNPTCWVVLRVCVVVVVVCVRACGGGGGGGLMLLCGPLSPSRYPPSQGHPPSFPSSFSSSFFPWSIASGCRRKATAYPAWGVGHVGKRRAASFSNTTCAVCGSCVFCKPPLHGCWLLHLEVHVHSPL